MQVVGFTPSHPTPKKSTRHTLSKRLDEFQSQNGGFNMDENRLLLSGIEQLFFDLSALDLVMLSSDLFRLPRYRPKSSEN
jgi:hypothetical protein